MASARDVVDHFLSVGLRQDRNPNPFVDASWYYENNPDVFRAGVSAFVHFNEYGWKEGRDPGPWFSTSGYLAANPDVAAAEINPLLHYLTCGAAEGRRAMGALKALGPVAFLLVRKEDEGSWLEGSWAAELSAKGFRVSRDPREALRPVGFIRSALRRVAGADADGGGSLRVSINGAHLTRGTARRLGHTLAVVVETSEAVEAMSPPLRRALAGAHCLTSSLAGAAVMSELAPQTEVAFFPEPFAAEMLQSLAVSRPIQVAWFGAARGRPRADAPSGARVDETEVVARFAHRGLRLVSGGGWSGLVAEGSAAAHWPSFREEHRATATFNGFAHARLALLTHTPARHGELDERTMLSLASGALPVASYELADALISRLGEDCPVPMYKSAEEMADIISHYLEFENERLRLAAKCVARVAGLATYSTRIGELLRRIGLAAPI